MGKYLFVIDMQNDFVTGPLGSEAAQEIVKNIKNKIKENVWTRVFFTRDTHFKDYLSISEGKNLPIVHCLKGTPGWCIIDELYEFCGEHNVIDKKNNFSLDWKRFFELSEGVTIPKSDFEYDEVEFVGVCTDICVISNALALKAINPHAKIAVDSSCCAGTTTRKHRCALEVMESCQIKIL